MKLWIKDSSTLTHHIIYINSEALHGLTFIGDLDDTALTAYLQALSSKLNIEKNLKLIHYFGYIHIYAKKEAS